MGGGPQGGNVISTEGNAIAIFFLTCMLLFDCFLLLFLINIYLLILILCV